MPYVDITGDIVVVHYVRNIEYITEKEFIPSYETRVYDLSKLRSVDMILSDWGLRYIAHTMVSFGFDDGRYLCFSIETRKEEGEEYSAIKGFFRQFELIYLAGDERDLVRLRTNVRQGEDVYLYRLKIASVDNARNALMEYLERINHLHNHPEWYNALTENCMTSSYRLTRKHALPERAKWHWSIILNGFSDRYAYEKGIIDTSLAFEELKRISRINARAVSADDATDFSRMIREGLPGMDWYSEL
ncbi:Lnb N-terminal periplasmic domain-containing protein [Desulfatiferula olefinivorans]